MTVGIRLKRPRDENTNLEVIFCVRCLFRRERLCFDDLRSSFCFPKQQRQHQRRPRHSNKSSSGIQNPSSLGPDLNTELIHQGVISIRK